LKSSPRFEATRHRAEERLRVLSAVDPQPAAELSPVVAAPRVVARRGVRPVEVAVVLGVVVPARRLT
jgi:hypothetical protein